MGVSGSGKSTLGSAISKALSIPFIEGDDYHTKANIKKMKKRNNTENNWKHSNIWKKNEKT